MSQLDLYDHGYNFPPNPTADTMLGQLVDWFWYNLWFANPFYDKIRFNKFNSPVWSIPVEFRGSLMVFLTSLGLARSRTNFRTFALITMTVFWMSYASAEMMLFSAGMVCGDLHYMHRPCPVPDLSSLALLPMDQKVVEILQPTSTTTKRQSTRRNVCCVAMFLVLLWLLSQPWPVEGAASSVGYQTLETMIPPSFRGRQNQEMFYPCLAAMGIVALIDWAGQGSWLQSIFCTRIFQWLGKVSFSMYLCHWPVQFSVTSRIGRLLAANWDVRGGVYDKSYGGVVIGAVCLSFPLLAILSEISTVVLDEGSVKLARMMAQL